MSTAAETIWRLHNGVDTAELVQRDDGSVYATATVVDADGTEVRRQVLVQGPTPRALSAAEKRRNAIAAEIAASPFGPRAAERYLRGEFEAGPQLPVLKPRPPAPPRPDAYDVVAEDRARVRALTDALENPRPAPPVAEVSPADERREARLDLALETAIEEWRKRL